MPLVSTRVYAFLFLLLVATNTFLFRAVSSADNAQVETFQAGKRAVTVVQKNGKVIVVGSGSDASVLRVLGRALPPWEREIDLLVLKTGGAPGGAPDILRHYTVIDTLYLKNGEGVSVDGTFVPIK